MKIGIDASRYCLSQATGVEWYSWHIIRALLRQLDAHDEIVLYARENLELDFLPSFAKATEGGWVSVKILSAKRLWTLKHLSREMSKNSPEVLFVPSHVLPLFLPGKTVITIHDVAFRHLKSVYSFFQYHYLNWSTKFAVKNASKIIVPSQATAQDLQHFFECKPEKIVVIPHGFEAPSQGGAVAERANKARQEKIFEESEIFQYFEIKPEWKYFLFVGRLESKKNLVRLVEAFGIFLEKNPDYKLILAGKRGVGFEAIWKKIVELGLQDKVIMPGYISEEEKATLFKYCRAFVFPSLYEGFGLPVLEAFYYEKPVLCSKVSSLPEVGAEAVHYVDPYNVKEMGEGLDLLARKDEYVKELVEKGRERLKKFSWKEAARRTWAVIKNSERDWKTQYH